MSLFRFIRTNPTTHLMVFRRGKLIQQGAGLALVYFAPTTSLVAIPMESRKKSAPRQQICSRALTLPTRQ